MRARDLATPRAPDDSLAPDSAPMFLTRQPGRAARVPASAARRPRAARAAVPQLAEWVGRDATRRADEIQAVPWLIRRNEQIIESLNPADRTKVLEAIATTRRLRAPAARHDPRALSGHRPPVTPDAASAPHRRDRVSGQGPRPASVSPDHRRSPRAYPVDACVRGDRRGGRQAGRREHLSALAMLQPSKREVVAVCRAVAMMSA